MTCTIRLANPTYTIQFDAPKDDILFTSVMLNSPAKTVGAVQCGRRNANPSGYVLHGCGGRSVGDAVNLASLTKYNRGRAKPSRVGPDWL